MDNAAVDNSSLPSSSFVLKIRTASSDDLASLVEALGQPRYFADRLDKQRNGHGVLLLALVRRTVVGAVYLWLAEAEEPEIRAHLSGVPLLTHLEVVPAYRNRGIGSRLIAVTEARAKRRGRDRIALAVSLDNWDAERLYKRLGYRSWGTIECRDDEGRPEWCHVLVKALPVRRAKIFATTYKAKFGQPLLRMMPTRTSTVSDVPAPSAPIGSPCSKVVDAQLRFNEPAPPERSVEGRSYPLFPFEIKRRDPFDDITNKLPASIEKTIPEIGISLLDPSAPVKQPEYPLGQTVAKLL